MRKLFLIASFIVISVLSQSTIAQAKYDHPMRWPTVAHEVTAKFHDPFYVFKDYFAHDGIDIANPQGSPVYAAKDGVVAVKHADGSTDYAYVMLVHKNNLATVYGELSEVVVKKDQVVKRGQLIGYSGGEPGTTGAGAYTTGPHLHFKVMKNGLSVDPMNYVRKK